MILDEYVNGWSVDLAKRMLTDAIIKNDYNIDAVFAHNDIINGKLITRENIDRVLIAPGHFTHEQIYGN